MKEKPEKLVCPVCGNASVPNCREEWNGIRGPGARIISRQYACGNCGVMFSHTGGWKPSPTEDGGEEMSEKGDLANPWTSLDDIAQSGWHVESNGMTIYWRNKETREARPIPYWVKQLISRARVEAEENTKRQIRETIGLSIK